MLRTSILAIQFLAGSSLGAWASPPATRDASPATSTMLRVPFEEPLVPLGRATVAETADLKQAIQRYQTRGVTEDLSSFDAFLTAHPESAWRPSLLLDLGLTYRHTGYFLRALRAWEAAWSSSKGDGSLAGRRVADRAVCELIELYCRLGRRERVKELFSEIQGRKLEGAAAERVNDLKDAVWLMDHEPGTSFRCGPLSLEACARVLGKSEAVKDLDLCRSTQQGTSLLQNLEWAKAAGMDFQAAFRAPGSPVVVPSVVHWKAGHFAAIVKSERGRFLLQDPTFGKEFWVSQAALDAEASGYALVPEGPMPQGWRAVPASEASQVHGKGTVSGKSPDGPHPDRKRPQSCPASSGPGMPAYTFDLSDIALEIQDTPVGYTPPRGYPVDFQLTYSQQDTYQPATCSFSNVGPLWNFGWLSYITDDPANPGQSVTSRSGIGGQSSYTGYDATTGLFSPEFHSQDQLQRTGPSAYVLTHGDGSKDVYAQADGSSTYPRRIFLTQRVDPAGNATLFGYDAQFRLVTVTDALGQVTTLAYDLGSDPYKVTQVTDPFGRTAKLGYNASGQLTSLRDAEGMTSSFAYGPTPANPEATANFINAMTTPYGTTAFASGGASANKWWVTATDPLGNQEHMEFGQAVPGYGPLSKVPPGCNNAFLIYRNVFYWDKRAMAVAPGDYNQAHVYHFLHDASNGSLMSPTLESERGPLDAWTFHTYPGQTYSYAEGTSAQPSSTLRLLDDGTTQAHRFQYNAFGRLTQATDPAGRITSYIYSANGIDLLEVHNITGGQNDLLAKYTYNDQHRPLTVTDASGQVTTFTYNTYGEVTSVTNAKGETTTLVYDGAGYLQSIQGPFAGALTTFTYDAVGRIRTVTNPDGYTLTYDYDNLDRRTKVTFPDGTTEQTVYDRLDVARTKDRLDRWTLMTYNAIRQLTDVQDPQGRVTHLNWCGCGSLESLVDPMGRITSWARDLEGRVTAKIYPDLTQTAYAYDSAGRLVQRTDAKGQVTSYGYLIDDDLKSVSYTHAVVPTPPASYTYDSRYNRLASSTGVLGTTTYAYNPVSSSPSPGATRLASVLSPMPNSAITYGYDELGRVVSRSINGVAETRGYDPLGRITTVTNPLGTFSYSYDGATSRLLSVTYPNGQVTHYTYLDDAGDHRLQSIQNLKSTGDNISTFSYTYDSSGQIQTWSQAADAQAPKVYQFSYDAVGQLLGATLKDSATSQILKSYIYGYDDAGNRTSEHINDAVTTSTYNELNQLTGQTFSPTPSFSGGSLNPSIPSIKAAPGRVKSRSHAQAQQPKGRK